MGGSSNELDSRYRIRSCSLPSKSNPINKRIEEELVKLRNKEEASTSPAETISIGLSGLADLYSCINQVLCLPLTQQALSLRHHEKCIFELLKGCSHLLNVSSSLVRELVLQQNKLIKDMQIALSTQNEGLGDFESKIATYTCSRKEVISKSKQLILSLKPLIHSDSYGSSRLLEEDHRLSTMTNALNCISIINISVVESLLFLLSIPVSRPKSGSLISKLIHKSKGTLIAKSGNELKDVETAFYSLSSGVNSEKLQLTRQRLEHFMGVMEGIRIGLDNACMQLSETKACLVNIVSF